MGKRFTAQKLCVVIAACMAFVYLNDPIMVIAQTSQNDQDDVRRIWDDGFLRKRPRERRAGVPDHNYRRVSSTTGRRRRRAATDSILGVTLWRLRPSIASDTNQIRELIHDKASKQEIFLTPERVEAETPISAGEFVRLSLEVPRVGYMYVINREQYADGTFGSATLIFPTRRINRGDNRVSPGQVVQIPTQEDDPPYLTVRPNPARDDQVAEVLTIIVTKNLLDITVPVEAMRLSPELVGEWERKWTAPDGRLELTDGAGRTRTNAERIAVVNRRRLRQNEAPPQTMYYRVGTKPNTPFLVNVKLIFTKSKSK